MAERARRFADRPIRIASSALPADEPIRLSPYDPGWPARFEQERAALADAIGEWIVGGIHHVGSTAVPGLEAKPIIDILAGVRDLKESRKCFEPLAQLGYMYAPYLPDEMHWFCKPHPSRRTHHLHLIPVGSKRYADELAFRDRLRRDPKTVGEYLALKRSLAGRFANDRGPIRTPSQISSAASSVKVARASRRSIRSHGPQLVATGRASMTLGIAPSSGQPS